MPAAGSAPPPVVRRRDRRRANGDARGWKGALVAAPAAAGCDAAEARIVRRWRGLTPRGYSAARGPAPTAGGRMGGCAARKALLDLARKHDTSHPPRVAGDNARGAVAPGDRSGCP